MKSRGFTLAQLLLVLAAVAIIATAVVYTTQRLGSQRLPAKNGDQAVNANTADAAKDWKTYSNDSLGVSFKLPASFGDGGKLSCRGQLFSGEGNIMYACGEGAVSAPLLQKDKDLVNVHNLQPATLSGKSGYQFIDSWLGCVKYNIQMSVEENRWFRLSYTPCIDAHTSGGGQEELFPQIVSTLQFTDQTAATEDSKLLDEDRLVRVRYPKSYTLEKSTERNRRGSFAAYNIIPQGTAPYLNELQLFSLESVTQFIEACQKRSDPCFFGDYPTVERFQGMQKAFTAGTSYQGYSLNTIGSEKYLIKNIEAQGEGGLFREYNSFVGTTMVTIWVYMRDASGNAQADTLVAPWSLEYSGM